MLHPKGGSNTIPWSNDKSILVLKDHSATIDFGKSLVQYLAQEKILLLEGPLGSGKTSLVKGIAEGLSIQDPITSPTFALSHHYLSGKRALIHLDLYRLADPLAADELVLQEEELAEDHDGLMIIEWPSRLSIQMPDASLMKLKYEPSGGRQIQII